MTERTAGELLSELCGETVAITRRHWGKGPTKCRAAWAGPDTLVLMLSDGLTAAEQTVRSAGGEEAVMSFRGLYHEAMNDRMIDLVERLTSRPVRAAMNASHADPDLTALLFVFEPEGPAQSS
jgi:uncharacterized protein YbcI